MRVEWLSPAIDDLQRLRNFILPHNPTAARRAVQVIKAAVGLLSVNGMVLHSGNNRFGGMEFMGDLLLGHTCCAAGQGRVIQRVRSPPRKAGQPPGSKSLEALW